MRVVPGRNIWPFGSASLQAYVYEFRVPLLVSLPRKHRCRPLDRADGNSWNCGGPWTAPRSATSDKNPRRPTLDRSFKVLHAGFSIRWFTNCPLSLSFSDLITWSSCIIFSSVNRKFSDNMVCNFSEIIEIFSGLLKVSIPRARDTSWGSRIVWFKSTSNRLSSGRSDSSGRRPLPRTTLLMISSSLRAWTSDSLFMSKALETPETAPPCNTGESFACRFTGKWWMKEMCHSPNNSVMAKTTTGRVRQLLLRLSACFETGDPGDAILVLGYDLTLRLPGRAHHHIQL